MQSSFLDKPDY